MPRNGGVRRRVARGSRALDSAEGAQRQAATPGAPLQNASFWSSSRAELGEVGVARGKRSAIAARKTFALWSAH